MAVCDVVDTEYSCPHCGGCIILSMAYYADGGVSSHVSHQTSEGDVTELKDFIRNERIIWKDFEEPHV